MREILFRGKDIAGNWHYGVPLVFTEDYVCMTAPHTYNKQVEASTVGQYTGLTDKNGKKIFEGDLLNGFEYPFLSDNAHNYFAEVIWFDNCPAFGLYTHKHPLSAVRGISEGNCELMEDFDSSQWEVIGNIHDNPELLGGADNG